MYVIIIIYWTPTEHRHLARSFKAAENAGELCRIFDGNVLHDQTATIFLFSNDKMSTGTNFFSISENWAIEKIKITF